ncbi:MAG: hypothetical protein E7282_01635 [Lachnospiraceae bacterium]|nr:hypothetical protein [Lachnospiraceae bacterium]
MDPLFVFGGLFLVFVLLSVYLYYLAKMKKVAHVSIPFEICAVLIVLYMLTPLSNTFVFLYPSIVEVIYILVNVCYRKVKKIDSF